MKSEVQSYVTSLDVVQHLSWYVQSRHWKLNKRTLMLSVLKSQVEGALLRKMLLQRAPNLLLISTT